MKNEVPCEKGVGQVISKFVFSWQGEMIVAFENGTYTIFKAEMDHHNESADISTTTLDLENWSDSNLLESGIFTVEELKEVRKAAAIKFGLDRNKGDRAAYIRLREKFEPCGEWRD